MKPVPAHMKIRKPMPAKPPTVEVPRTVSRRRPTKGRGAPYGLPAPAQAPARARDPVTAPAAIVHYHEISLKRGNRPLFLRHLQQNVLRAVGDLGPVRLVQLPGRIHVGLPRHPDPERLGERLARVCGIANFSL